MKDINAELDNILVTYGIIKRVKLDKAISVIRELELKYKQGKKIGLYGCGKQSAGLLVFISKYTQDLKIEYCFDKSARIYTYRDRINNIGVLPIEKVFDKQIDCILIGSYGFHKELIDNLHAINFCGEIIDPYEHLGEYIDENFSNYEIIYNLRQEYKTANKEKELLLQQLIKQYLLIKDFLSAFEVIDLYCKNRYSNFNKYLNLKSSLNDMLNGIKDFINSRQKRDILWNWVDGVSYYELCKFPFLSKEAEEGVNFKNAYTVIPWTTSAKKTMLFGEYPIEGKIYLHETLKSEDIKLLQILDQNGYDFGYCGVPRFARLFDTSVVLPPTIYEDKFPSSLQKQWEALSMLCMSEKPMCIFIHTAYETHQPFICGEGDTYTIFDSRKEDWAQEACRKQADIAGKYIDKRLQFYGQFYGKDAVKIYMSDHGRVGNLPMDENKIHTFFIVSGRDIKNKDVEGIFSLVRFPDLVEKIIHGDHNWNELTNDYAMIENYDAYEIKLVNRVLSGEIPREEMSQCRGIVTLKDKYFLYVYGKEYYFNSLTSDRNEIDNPLYAERIEQLRKLCGNEFVDIYKYDKFKHSRLLYNEGDQA